MDRIKSEARIKKFVRWERKRKEAKNGNEAKYLYPCPGVGIAGKRR